MPPVDRVSVDRCTDKADSIRAGQTLRATCVLATLGLSKQEKREIISPSVLPLRVSIDPTPDADATLHADAQHRSVAFV